MTGFDSKRQAAQDKMELADAYASAVAETPHMPTPLERRLSTERIERARNALEAALEQQAEPPPEWPLIKNIIDEYGLDAIAFVAEWKAAQQQAEPVDCWDIGEDNPDSLAKHPAFRATQEQQAEPPQRQWVGLEIEEVQDSYNSDYQSQTRAVEKLLKERNA